MKGIRMKAALELIAQRDVPDNVNLWARIAERVERKNFMQTIRTRPVLALFLVLLALALISSVAYAIGKVTGYIPGVGLVNQSASLRMLAEPVRVKQKGLRVTIQKLVTNVDRTFVAYRVDGISPSTTGFPMCGEMPSLQLPDGSTLSFLSGGGGSLGGEMGSLRFETTAYYPPIPANVDHVIFTFPCILP